jgi:hypothetical protein
MRFKLGNIEYRVRWEFTQNKRRQTTRAIVEIKEPKMSGSVWLETLRGESHCHPNDAFDRVLGQRKALADALGPWPKTDARHGNEVPADQRHIIWTEFERIREQAQKQQVASIRQALSRAPLELSGAAMERLLQDIVNETAPGIPHAPETPQAPAEGQETPSGAEHSAAVVAAFPAVETTLLAALAEATEPLGGPESPLRQQLRQQAEKEAKNDDIPF